jgi:hypothetical protein
MKTFVALLAGMMVVSGAGGAAQLDGLRVENGGSTNTAPWALWLRSDGTGSVETDPAGRAFTIDPALAERVFANVAAARDAKGEAGHCMKSASFGSRTVVQWHGWTSPDLSCPQGSPSLAALAADIAQVQSLAQIGPALRRPLQPYEPRRAPSEGSPVTPAPEKTPRRSSSDEIQRQQP